jgi:peptidoglycan/LPS O-acetylase OafA/YrhL
VREYTPLGLFRLTLAVLVLVAHARFLFDGGALFALAPEQAGVVLFFVVSGFVMPSAWLAFYRGQPGRFLVNRFVRLLPPFWTVFAIVAIVQSGPASFRTVAINAAMMGPFFNATWPASVAPIWTVFVEFNYYVSYFAVFWLIARGVAARTGFTLYLAACALAYLMVAATGGYHRFFGALQWAPYFGLGTALFCWRRAILPQPLALGFIVLCAALATHQYAASYVQAANVGLATIAVLALMAILAILTGPLPGGRWRVADRLVGDLTYPLYLCHVPVIAALEEWGLARAPDRIWIVLAASFAAAAALHLAVEKPLGKARSAVRGARLKPERAEVAAPPPPVAPTRQS